METLISQIENNKNFNGGGLAVNITGRYESNRHAIAKIEKVTFGEAVKFLKTKKGGNFQISANLLLDAYRAAIGEPEWHHAGFLPKSYGGGMKKTYFLDETPTAATVIKWLKKYSSKSVKRLKSRFEANILEQKKSTFLKEHAKQFTRLSSVPNFAVNIVWEMNGKFGWFESQSRYTLPEYASGWEFESEEKKNEYLEIK